MDDDTDLRNRAALLRDEGLTRRQIMDRLGIQSRYHLNRLLQSEIPPDCRLRVRAKDELRFRARELRREGRTYDEIQAALGVSKSSISLWVSDLPKPPPRFVSPEEAKAASDKRWEPFRRRREAECKAVKAEAARFVGGVSERELLLLGAVLYWAEGSKDKVYDRRERITFINSDPNVIRLFLAWLDLLEVPQGRRKFALSIHESADIGEAHHFWLGVTGAPEEQFRRPILKRHNPRTVRKNVGADYHGCLIVDVLQSRDLYRRMEGWWYGIVGAATQQSAVG